MKVTIEEFCKAWNFLSRNQYTNPSETCFNNMRIGYHYCKCWEDCRGNIGKKGCCVVLFLCENGLYEYDDKEENRAVTGITPKGRVVLPILEKANTEFEIGIALIMGECVLEFSFPKPIHKPQ